MKFLIIFLSAFAFLVSCNMNNTTDQEIPLHDSSMGNNEAVSADTVIKRERILTGDILPDSIVSYAETLKGIPYKYGSTDPQEGFDCSGFITYVFNRFNIKVPRSSVEFTNVGQEVPLPLARRGDLILFTGTDSLIRIVGHMGIVTSNADTLKFIHSTSGRQYGVTETALNNYYRGRFVKVVRIFNS